MGRRDKENREGRELCKFVMKEGRVRRKAIILVKEEGDRSEYIRLCANMECRDE